MGEHGHAGREAGFILLAILALSLSDVWFDMAGHGTAFADLNASLSNSVADGHTLFLLGMLVLVALQAAFPTWSERHFSLALGVGTLLATTAAIVYCYASDGASPLATASVLAIGLTNAFQLNCALWLLSFASSRRSIMLGVAGAVAFKTLFVSTANQFIGTFGQKVLFIVVPLVFMECCLAARRLSRDGKMVAPCDRMKFQKPLSTAMLGILVASSVIFATTRAVSSMGFWGTRYALMDAHPLTWLVATAVFMVICYFTLVRLDTNLLFRFLPGLMVLFIAYLFLYAGIGLHLGLETTGGMAVFAQYAELYGEAYTFSIVLLAVRTLDIPPYRVIGLQMSAYTVVELAMQLCIETYDRAGMIIVTLCFCLIMIVLMWALYHFYGIQGFGKQGQACPNCPLANPPLERQGGGQGGSIAPPGAAQPGGGPRPAPTPPAPTERDPRLELASSRGLTDRETEVFLLLAQGRSRRFISDELFLAEGTVSKYVQRVYEKLGVHSKQELLSLVLGHDARDER